MGSPDHTRAHSAESSLILFSLRYSSSAATSSSLSASDSAITERDRRNGDRAPCNFLPATSELTKANIGGDVEVVSLTGLFQLRLLFCRRVRRSRSKQDPFVRPLSDNRQLALARHSIAEDDW